ARHQEVFLHKSQLLSRTGGVVRVQHTRERFGLESRTQCANEVAGAEFLKIEVVGCSRRPEAETVNGLSSVAHDRPIIGYAEKAGWPVRNNFEAPVAQLEGAVELDFHFLVLPRDLPGVAVAEPVVGVFLLP